MKQLLIIFSIILFASCDDEQATPKSIQIQGNVSFSVDRTKLPTQFAHISIDNVSVGAIVGNESLNVKTKDTLIHTYRVLIYDPLLAFDTIAGQFKARNRQTVKIVIPNE